MRFSKSGNRVGKDGRLALVNRIPPPLRALRSFAIFAPKSLIPSRKARKGTPETLRSSLPSVCLDIGFKFPPLIRPLIIHR